VGCRVQGLGLRVQGVGFRIHGLWSRVYGSELRVSIEGEGFKPPKALRGGISKSILQRPCQFLAINAHEMAPRTKRWLQERRRDTPT